MKTEKRWIAAAIREAAETEVQMPWSRGARRAAWIAKRRAAESGAPELARA